jgi:long-chain fatty acid transport protein
MKGKWLVVLCSSLALLFLASPSIATNGYQLIGIGSYQMSLAGAVTALPGSNMTAVTNPAGMMRIGSRADFSMEAFMPERETMFPGGNKVKSSSDLYGIPSIGWNGPVGSRDNLVFGGGMYGTSGMGVDYGSTDMGDGAHWDGYSSIAFWQMAPALAWQATDRLSLGGSVNIDFQQVAFEQRIPEYNMIFDLGRGASAIGFGLSFGLLYDVNDLITLGVSYKSKQFFSDLEYQLAEGDISFMHDDQLVSYPAGTYKLDLDFPQQAAAGIAIHVIEALTIAADVKWIDWSDTMDTLTVTGPAEFPMDPGWDDQVVFALGVAYRVNDRFNLRAGFNYGESPIDEKSAGQNLLLPAVVEQHYTFGADYRMDDHWDIGFHYMYVPENKITAAPGTQFEGTTISLAEQAIGLNLGYRF